MRALALDFDGVISDSAPESFVVALRTFVRLRPASALRRELTGLEGSLAPGLAAVRASRLYAPFLERMPLGNRAEDYAVVLRSLEEGVPLPDQERYDAYRSRQDAAWLDAFHQAFYQERHALAEADRVGWQGLMAPYAPLLEVLARRASHTLLAIATAKDRRSVEALLALYGATALFAPERIFDKETGVGKTAHLSRLHEQEGVAYRDITFVDDKVNHLDAVAPLGVRCALAAWGYNGPREQRLARERGYPVLQLEGAEAELFGEASGG